ncbi:MAG: hypothetical protein WAK48_11735 [Candidatus Acidiferrum sp.]|jgi:hypothetical protein
MKSALHALFLTLLPAASIPKCWVSDPSPDSSSDFSAADAPQSGSSSQGGFFHDWFFDGGRDQSEQPHWMTPLATTTPRLEQEFRYDIQTQPHNSGLVTDNFGASKGFEIIPLKR